MNKDKLKIKYLFNLFKLTPSYPTPEDVLYSFIVGLTEKNKLNGFGKRDLQRLGKLPAGETISSMLEKFIELGYFRERDEIDGIDGIDKTNKYKFLKHPW